MCGSSERLDFMSGNSERLDHLSGSSERLDYNVTPSKDGGVVAGVSLSPSSGAGSPGQVPGGSPPDGFLWTFSPSAGATQIAHAKPVL